jgi:transcriptional regulator with PAS, ATPase and Fis domain
VLDKSISILTQGESGVGKEYFARAVHGASQRAKDPFAALNYDSIPENWIETQRFGFAPGAFTGGNKEGNLGRLPEANGDTAGRRKNAVGRLRLGFCHALQLARSRRQRAC